MPLLDQSLVDGVIKRALRSGADFVELFVERKRNQSISVEESKVQRVSSGNDLGAGLRIIHQGTVSYVYTEDLSEAGLLKTADLAAQVGRHGGGRFAFGDLTGAPRAPQPIEVPPHTVGPEAKIELLLEADQAAREVSGAIKQVAVGYGHSAQEVLVATSEGIHHSDSRTRVRLMIHAVAERNGEIQTAMEAPGMQRGFEFFDDTSAAEYARTAAERAVSLLDAAPSPAGPMAVIIGNEFGGVLFHEACGHGLEADFVGKGSTVFTGKIGQAVASPIVTAIDDFVFAVTEGYLVEGGKIGRPVRGATIVGNGPRALHKIDMVANDLKLAPGTCGKEGQGVPVSVGQPTIRISELTVGGTGVVAAGTMRQ